MNHMFFSYNENTPRRQREVFISDGDIIKITCDNEKTRFYFNKGLCCVKGESISNTGGYIEFLGCSSEDFFCSIFRRYRVFGKLIFRGKRVSLMEISSLLKNHSLEIYKEICEENSFLWRGAVLPYRKGLSDIVNLELDGSYQINYCIYGTGDGSVSQGDRQSEKNSTTQN